MDGTLTFHTMFAKGFTGGALLIGIIILGHTLIVNGFVELLQIAPYVLLVMVFVWILFGHPKVTIDDNGISIINVARTVHLPWSSVSAVRTRWALTLETGSRRYTSWAIPASNTMKTRALTFLRSTEKQSRETQEETFSNTAEGAADAITDRLAIAREAGHSGSSGALSPTITWNIREILLLVVAAALLVTTVISR